MKFNIVVPTHDQFRSLTGRSGAGRVFKRRNDLDTIFRELEKYDRIRNLAGPEELARLRALRRQCIAWLDGNKGAGRKSEPAVRDLLNCAHARYLAICEMKYAGADRGQDIDSRRALAAKPKLARGVIGSELADAQAGEAARKIHWGGLGAGQLMEREHGEYKRVGGSLSTGAFAKYVFLPSAEDDPSGKYLGLAAFDNMHRRVLDGVKYCTPEERAAYKLDVRGGLLYDASGDSYDTTSRCTEASGAGWAIFVLGLDGHVYSNSHELDCFHHSSFFAGEAVACGGELCVVNGRLRYITAKTGHYQSKFPEFVKALRYFNQRGIDLSRVLACPAPHEDRQFYRANEVLAQRGDTGGAAAPRLAAGGHRGPAARGATLTPVLDHFPAKVWNTPNEPEWPASMG